MRIAIFTKRTVFHDGFGGLETHTTVLAEELTKRGYSVVVFAPQYKLSYQSKVQNGVTYRFVPSVYRMLFKNSSDNWYSASQQAFKLEHANEKFALVISQSSAGVGIIDNRDYFKVPVLSIAHGSILSEYKTRLLSVASVKDTAYLLKDILFVLINYFGRQRDFILGSSHVVAVSNAVKNSVIDETFVSEDNITVIHNGIDPSVFANITSKKETSSLTLVFIGRLEYVKGVHVLLKALYALQNSFVKLLIIGDGPYRSYLENYVTSRNLSEQVTFKGKLSHVEAMQTLLDADVYVLPTLRVEGFPMTLPEAMFARLPLIVSDLGGNKEAIEEGKNGYIVPAGDVPALIEKINSFVDNRNLVISMGDYSYKKASSEFSIDEMLNSYIEIIKKITK